MTEQILNGEDIRGMFLLSDTLKHRSYQLLKKYIEKLKEKDYNILVINPERPDLLPETVEYPPNQLTTSKTVIVVLSVSFLLALKDIPFEDFYKQVVRWNRCPNVSQVILVEHEDLSTENILSQLEYLSTQRIRLLERLSNSEYLVHTVWKKPRGKAIVENCQFHIEDNKLCKFEIIVNPEPVAIPEDPQKAAQDLLNNLTFNLKIKEDEQRDKNNLVLPYTELGQITYTLDKEDDFDEEDDPDDDLDI